MINKEQFVDQIHLSLAAIDSVAKQYDEIKKAADILVATARMDGIIFAAGNGGSASDASHFVAELMGGFRDHSRRPVHAVSLSADTSVLTAVANDYGYKYAFSRQVAVAMPGDVLLAISTSGMSPNVLEAAIVAREHGASVIALTGETGGHLKNSADVWIKVASNDTPRIQEAHGLVVHLLAEMVEKELHK